MHLTRPPKVSKLDPVILCALVTCAFMACGLFVGPATAPSGPCHETLDCGALGCCVGTPDDGWECNAPGAATPCTFVGLGSSVFGGKKTPSDAGPGAP